MANSPQADSYQVGNIVNAITSDKTGNIIFSDTQNPNGVMLTQIKNSLNDTGDYDTAGTANTVMSAVITASEAYTDTQISSFPDTIAAEITGRINADTLLQSQITDVSGDNLSEITGRINADTLLQSQIITISSNLPVFIQASPTPSLAVISGNTIIITHPAVTNGKIVPVAKINTGSLQSYPLAPMTSNFAPSPLVCSASKSCDFPSDIFWLFNHDDGGSAQWLSPWAPLSIILNLGAGNGIISTQYTIECPSAINGNNPTQFTFEGSNNGALWTLLDSQTGITWPFSKTTKTFTYINTVAYQYHRLTVIHSENNDNGTLAIFEVTIGAVQVQYDPAVIGRSGSLGVDVEVAHPTSTTTTFKNVTGSTNDFMFKVLLTS